MRHLDQGAASKKLPDFKHGGVVVHPGTGLTVVGCYHVSRQNTQTGRLTPRMFDTVLRRITGLLDDDRSKRR
jgi:uracil-DNA glycosylase